MESRRVGPFLATLSPLTVPVSVGRYVVSFHGGLDLFAFESVPDIVWEKEMDLR